MPTLAIPRNEGVRGSSPRVGFAEGCLCSLLGHGAFSKSMGQPRPMNGIFVAITVMNCTFASSGNDAM